MKLTKIAIPLFLLMFLISGLIQAQTTDCEGPGSFSITPPEGVQGSGTPEDPYIMCIDQPLELTSTGVNPNLGFVNAGLGFLIYVGQPTDANPEEDPNARLVALSDDSGIIFNNGTGTFANTGFQNDPNVTFPFTTYIVPIIVPDINMPGTFDSNCTGIDPDAQYPVVIFLDPADNPDCTLDTGECEATSGTPDFGAETTYCGESTITFTSTGFNADPAFTTFYVVTSDGDLIIQSLNQTGEFTLVEGNYILHVFNVSSDEVPPGVEDIIVGLPAQAVFDALVCYDIISSEVISILPPNDPACETGECEATSGTPNFGTETIFCGESTIAFSATGFNADPAFTTFYVVTSDGDLIIQSLNQTGEFTLAEGNYILHVFNVSSDEVPAGVEDIIVGLPAQAVFDALVCYDIISSEVISVLSLDDPACETGDCEANAGMPNFDELQSVYCGTTEISIVSDGFTSVDSAGESFLQGYAVTDPDSVVLQVTVNSPAIFTLEPGEYLVTVLNLPCSILEDFGLPCDAPPLDLLIGINANDFIGLATCADWTTSELITVLAEDDPACLMGCDALAGALVGVESFYCSGGLSIESTGFNESPDFVQASIVTDADLNIIALGAGNNVPFSLEPGTYILHALNLAAAEVPADLQALVGLNAGDVLATLLCFSLESSSPINVLTPIAYSFTVDCDANVANVNISGGYPQYNLDNNTGVGLNYIVQGNLGGDVAIGTAWSVPLADTTYNVSILDEAGCIQEETITLTACTTDPLTITDIVYTVDEATNIYTFTFDIAGGSGMYTVDNGALTGSTFTSIQVACGDDATVTIVDGNGETLTVPVTAPCTAVVDCPGLSEGGTLTGAQDFYCAGEPVQVSATGFNNGAEYTQLYVATQGASFIIAAVSTDGNFGALTAGTYELHTFNFYNENPPIIPANPIGVSAVEIVNQTETCFDLDPNAATTIGVLNPVSIAVDYDCDELTGVYFLTFSFAGGLPQYVAENGPTGVGGDALYTASADVSGTYEFGQNIVIEYTENTAYQITVTDQAGCSQSTSGTPSPCTKTAIELMNFEGRTEATGNNLYWATASEYNNDYFEVQKSIDGQSFETIGKVYGANNSNTTQEYDFTDTAIEMMTYYRLKIVDTEGKAEYSHTISLERSHTAVEGLQITPVPAQNIATIQFNTTQAEQMNLAIYDLTGKLVSQEWINTQEGINTLYLEVAQWQSGVYFLELSNNKESWVQRIIKE